MNFIEKKFKSYVKPHILKCCDEDWSHCLKDLSLLITAAYIHDIGWRDVLPPGKISFDKLLEFEEQANKNTKPFVTELLKELAYKKEEINKVIRLIEAADAHRSSLDDEAIIVDADNLSKLSIDHLKEKFKRSEWLRLYKMWEVEFPRRIKTEEGKRVYPRLLEKLRKAIWKRGKLTPEKAKELLAKLSLI